MAISIKNASIKNSHFGRTLGTPVDLIFYVDAANRKRYPGSGTTLTDMKGGLSGTMEDNATWIDNGVASCIDFPGNTDNATRVRYEDISATDPLCLLDGNPGDGFTFVFSHRRHTNRQWGRIIDKSNNTTGVNGWGMWYESPSYKLGFRYGGGGTLVQTGSAPSLNEWYIFQLTFEHSTKDWVWYMNDDVSSSGTTTMTLPSSGTETDMSIGNWNHNDGREINGDIGFLAIYGRPLTSSEVSQNFNSFKGRYGL